MPHIASDGGFRTHITWLQRWSDFKANVNPCALLPPSTLLLHSSSWLLVQSILWLSQWKDSQVTREQPDPKSAVPGTTIVLSSKSLICTVLDFFVGLIHKFTSKSADSKLTIKDLQKCIRFSFLSTRNYYQLCKTIISTFPVPQSRNGFIGWNKSVWCFFLCPRHL